MQTSKVQIRLLLGDGSHEGTVQEFFVTREGVVLRTRLPAGMPALLIGQKVSTSLKCLDSEKDLSAPGRVLFQGRIEDSMGCDLMYVADLEPALNDVLNQRQSLRVRPRASQPVRARATGGTRVEIYDISIGGLGLLVTHEDQAKLSDWRLGIFLMLPGQASSIELMCDIRYRKLYGSSVLYGVAFDERSTPLFEQKQKLIHQYVMQRQKELLRERSKRRSA